MNDFLSSAEEGLVSAFFIAFNALMELWAETGFYRRVGSHPDHFAAG